MLLVVPLVAITGFPQWIPHFSALAFDDDDDDDLPWPVYGCSRKVEMPSSLLD
jgi:hypothetical protein